MSFSLEKLNTDYILEYYINKSINVKGFYMVDLFDEKNRLLMSTKENVYNLESTVDKSLRFMHNNLKFVKLINNDTFKMVSKNALEVVFVKYYMFRNKEILEIGTNGIEYKYAKNRNAYLYSFYIDLLFELNNRKNEN